MFNEEEVQPQNHKEIYTQKQFIETFLHFFKEGASSERIAVNQTLVHEIVSKIDEMKLDHYKDIGCHAPTFSKRIVKEGCTAFFPGRFTDFTEKTMKSNNVSYHNWNEEGVNDEVEDIHICVLYQKDDTFFGYESVRSNRFYFIIDPKGSKLKYVEDYHKTLNMAKDFSKNIHKHMFAGYQYMEALTKEEIKERFLVMNSEWKKLKENDPESEIHLELAHFNYYYTLHYIIKHLFPFADSVGLNEQEIVSTINEFIFYQNILKDDDLDEEFLISPSRLSVYESIDLIHKLISKYISKNFENISRVQYHTLGHMITWYDPDIWESAENSLFRSGYASSTFCNQYSDQSTLPLWETHSIKPLNINDLEGNLIPIHIESKFENSTTFVQYFKIDQTKFICGVVSTPVWKKPSRLTGMGDNISSTGFIYHNKKKKAIENENNN